MQALTAREILHTPLLTAWNTYTDKAYLVTYEDGEQEVTSAKSVVFNRYIWIPFETYPHTPITKECSPS